jgi:putative MATE family efflux protein
VSISGQIVFIIHSVSIGLGNGGQVLISQQVGSRDYKRLSTTMGTLLSFCLLATVVSALIGAVGASLWVDLLQTPAEARSDAIAYLLICCLGSGFMSVCGTLCAILRGVGDSRRPMFILFVSAISNMIMDVWFIAGLGWGASGAAWATILAQAIGSVYALVSVYRRREQLGFDFKPASFRIERETLKAILKLGTPLVVMNASITLSMMVVVAFINVYGVAASAITGIGSKINSLVNVVTSSMQTAVGSMVAQNFAARKLDRVRKINRVSNVVCLVFFVFIGAAALLFPEQIIGIFTKSTETEVLALARPYMRIAFWTYLSCCLMTTSLGHINGVGFTTLNLIIALLDGVVGRIGISILLGQVLGWGVEGFWWGNSLAAYISVFMSIAYYLFGHWENRKLLLK